jgi:hypothetical protein
VRRTQALAERGDTGGPRRLERHLECPLGEKAQRERRRQPLFRIHAEANAVRERLHLGHGAQSVGRFSAFVEEPTVLGLAGEDLLPLDVVKREPKAPESHVCCRRVGGNPHPPRSTLHGHRRGLDRRARNHGRHECEQEHRARPSAKREGSATAPATHPLASLRPASAHSSCTAPGRAGTRSPARICASIIAHAL